MARRVSSVDHYYNTSTRMFTTLGRDRSGGAIHRPVWHDGVETAEEAISLVNSLVLAEARRMNAKDVLDLGCGVGGSIGYLCRRHPAAYRGVTISRLQKEMADRRLRRIGCRACDQAAIEVCDFTDERRLTANGKLHDLAYAIESFAHVTDVEAFFEAVSGAIMEGGRLLMCDDFLLQMPESSGSARKLLDRFQWGWHASSVMLPEVVCDCASRHGFKLVDTIDLTESLRVNTWRDRLLAVTRPVLALVSGRIEWCRSMVGGDALRTLINRGVVGYHFLRFSRTNESCKLQSNQIVRVE